MSANSSLHRAAKAKSDEFYTQLADIEKELGYYQKHFKDKVVFCNCDDPKESNFFKYFALNFKFLGLKKLISTHYNRGQKSYKLEVIKNITDDGNINLDDAIKTDLEGDGDFRSKECIEILKEADIVVTNPPFSLFREYIAQLIEHDKKFVIIGNQNDATTKETFSLIKENKIWIGYRSGDMEFKVPNYYEERQTRYRQDETGQKWRSLGNICWYTNLDIAKRHEDLILFKTYNKNEYPNYENYSAINVDKVADIPMNYDGVMGVPVTFLSKYNPSQFEIIGQTHSGDLSDEVENLRIDSKQRHRGIVNGKQKYARILIKNKRL